MGGLMNGLNGKYGTQSNNAQKISMESEKSQAPYSHDINHARMSEAGVGGSMLRLLFGAAKYLPIGTIASMGAARMVDWDRQEQLQKERGVKAVYPPRTNSDAVYYLPPNVGANWVSPEISDILYRHQGNILHGALAFSPLAIKGGHTILPHTAGPNAAYIAWSNATGRTQPQKYGVAGELQRDAEGQPGGFYGQVPRR